MKAPTRIVQSKPNLQTVKHNTVEAKIVIKAFSNFRKINPDYSDLEKITKRTDWGRE